MTVLPANVTSLGRLCMGSLEITLRNTWNRNQKSFFISSESHSDKQTASSVFKFQTEVTSRAIPPQFFQVTAHQLPGTNLPPQRAHQATPGQAARRSMGCNKSRDTLSVQAALRKQASWLMPRHRSQDCLAVQRWDLSPRSLPDSDDSILLSNWLRLLTRALPSMHVRLI